MDSRILLLLVVISAIQVLCSVPPPPAQKPQQPPKKPLTIIPPPKPVCQCQKVDGRWTEWTAFSPCLVSCGKGEQIRYRYCANPLPQHGGKRCKGQSKQTKKCNGIKPCPVNGGYGKFKWGKCSKPCGGGVQTGKSFCNNPTPKHCGKPCPKSFLVKTRKCNVDKCPCPKDAEKGCKKWEESCKSCNCKTKKRECNSKCIRADPKHCEYGKKTQRDCTPEQLKKCKPKPDEEGLCEPCHKKALDAASKLKGHWKTTFVGNSCHASDIGQQSRAIEFCKKATLSKTKNAPAFKWFYISCANNGPWCMPCATRGQKLNVEHDRCK